MSRKPSANRCPFCFESLSNRQYAFCCVNISAGGCSLVPDQHFAKYARLKEAPLRARTFETTSKRKHATCPACQHVSTLPACPSCHNELPFFPGESNNLIIGVIGARNAGKSHFLGVLIQTLKNSLGDQFGATLTPLNTLTEKRYQRDFQSHLYHQVNIIPSTQPARENQTVRLPLVYQMNFEQKGLIGKKRQQITLVFLDSAGEDLERSQSMVTENAYLPYADGLIFLVDPLQLRPVREKMRQQELPDMLEYDQLQLLHRIITFISARHHLKKGAPVPVPMAFCFSKIDRVTDQIDPVLLSRKQYPGFWEKSEGDYFHELWRGVASRWLTPQVLSYMESSFKNIQLMGLSSLGDQPDEKGRLTRGIDPIRIADPLLWLLAFYGLIPSKRQPTTQALP